jgi:hypothetical protein
LLWCSFSKVSCSSFVQWKSSGCLRDGCRCVDVLMRWWLRCWLCRCVDVGCCWVCVCVLMCWWQQHINNIRTDQQQINTSTTQQHNKTATQHSHQHSTNQHTNTIINTDVLRSVVDCWRVTSHHHNYPNHHHNHHHIITSLHHRVTHNHVITIIATSCHDTTIINRCVSWPLTSLVKFLVMMWCDKSDSWGLHGIEGRLCFLSTASPRIDRDEPHSGANCRHVFAWSHPKNVNLFRASRGKRSKTALSFRRSQNRQNVTFFASAASEHNLCFFLFS